MGEYTGHASPQTTVQHGDAAIPIKQRKGGWILFGCPFGRTPLLEGLHLTRHSVAVGHVQGRPTSAVWHVDVNAFLFHDDVKYSFGLRI